MRVDFDEPTASLCEEGKTIFTRDQRAALEAKFRRKKYPTRKEKVKLASKFGVDFCKVQVSLEQNKNTLTCALSFFMRICLTGILKLKFSKVK